MNTGFRRPEVFTFQEKRSTTLLHFPTVQKYVIMCAISAECQVVLEGVHAEGSPKMSVSLLYIPSDVETQHKVNTTVLLGDSYSLT